MADPQLVQAAAAAAARYSDGNQHTVAAAARAANGRIVVGMNVYHFTGGPCAELVVVGAAAANGERELKTIVAVGGGGRGVLSPCGRCRQVLFDYFPDINVLIGSMEEPRAVPIGDLLPEAFVWRR
jgi:cytidine deaminase